MELGSFIAGAAACALPVFILASWLSNTKTPLGKGRSEESGDSATQGSSRDKEGALSDKDMTSSK